MTQAPHTIVDQEYCVSEPDHYKLCSKSICVPISKTCPCQNGEVLCSDGRCLPYHLICHTEEQCLETDKETCFAHTEHGIPVPVLVAIVMVSVIACVLLALFLYFLYLRRQGSNISRESQAALDPLQNEKTDELNCTCSVNRNFKTRHKHSNENNIDRLSQNMCSNSYFDRSKFVNRINCFKTEDRCHECEKSTDSCISASEQYSGIKASEAIKKCNVTIYKKPMSSHESLLVKTKDTVENIVDISPKIHNTRAGAIDESPVKLGKYIYRPRSRKPPVIYHSYVPSHTEPSTPTSVDFDRDKIPFLFPQEFLCASTPKQTAKQMVFPAGQDIKFMDE